MWPLKLAFKNPESLQKQQIVDNYEESTNLVTVVSLTLFVNFEQAFFKHEAYFRHRFHLASLDIVRALSSSIIM